MSGPGEFGEPEPEQGPNPDDVAPTSTGPTTVLDMLLATDAGGRSVDDIQREYSLESRGVSTILLGIIKMSGTGGFPAVLDILAGLWLSAQETTVEDGEEPMGGEPMGEPL